MKDMSKYVKIIEGKYEYAVISFVKLFMIMYFVAYTAANLNSFNALNYVFLYTVILGNVALDLFLQKRYYNRAIKSTKSLDIKNAKDAKKALRTIIKVENDYRVLKKLEKGNENSETESYVQSGLAILYLGVFSVVFYKILDETNVNAVNVAAMTVAFFIMLVCIIKTVRFCEKMNTMLLSIEKNMLNKNKNIVFEKEDNIVETDSFKEMKKLIGQGYYFNIEVLEKRIN